MRWYLLLLTAVLLLGIVYVYLHRQELGLAGFGAMDDRAGRGIADIGGHPPGITWAKVDRPADGFKVEMPVDVKEIQIPAYNETGGSEQMEMIFANPSASTSFSVTWAENPPVARTNGRSADQTLDLARNNALARTQTTLTNESRTNVQGFPAREFAARNSGGGVLNSRLVLAGSHLYMLTAAFPSANARRERDVARFFNSFSITSTGNGTGGNGVDSAPNKSN
jgi:hypothetical protein